MNLNLLPLIGSWIRPVGRSISRDVDCYRVLRYHFDHGRVYLAFYCERWAYSRTLKRPIGETHLDRAYYTLNNMVPGFSSGVWISLPHRLYYRLIPDQHGQLTLF